MIPSPGVLRPPEVVEEYEPMRGLEAMSIGGGCGEGGAPFLYDGLDCIVGRPPGDCKPDLFDIDVWLVVRRDAMLFLMFIPL